MKNNNHVMVDIETLDNVSFSAITKIAAVRFNIKTGEVLDKFEVTVDLQSCIDLNMSINADTLLWWLETNADLLRDILNDQKKVKLGEALHMFRMWLDSNKPSNLYIWGNSNRFDLGILHNAYTKCDQGNKLPWLFRNERDVRTLIDLPNILNGLLTDKDVTTLNPNIKQAVIELNSGQKHNPIDDCLVQISYVVATMNNLSTFINKDSI